MRFTATVAAGIFAAFSLLMPSAYAQEAVNWSGPYATGFGEYSSGTSTQHDNGFVYAPPKQAVAAPAAKAPAPVVCPPGTSPVMVGGMTLCLPNDGPVADGRYGVSGAFGGAAIGYNYQFARVVLGLEGAIAGGHAAGSSNSCGTPAHECGTDVDAIADVRGRIGYSFGRLLPYIAGGLAIDHVLANDSLFHGQGRDWLTGYTVGGGVEYKLTSHLSIRAEYLHTDLGSKPLFNIVANVPERIGYCSDAVRVGLSYSLNAGLSEPVVARY